MTTITLFKIEPLPNKGGLVNRLNNVKKKGFWLKAKESKYNENEVEIDVWYEEDVEIGLRRAFSEEAYEMVDYFRNNGKEKIIRKVYCFVNLELGTLEIYRGIDAITYKIKEIIEKLLEVNLTSVSLDSGHLMHIVTKYSSELKQAMFKHIHGLWYHIIRGRHLENNGKYKDFIVTKPDSLRCVSIIPKIKYLNGSEYSVTINGDKGTIKMWDGMFKWKPRLEVRQIVSIVANVAKLSPF
ncbi:MAG: hypothetical protein QMD36_02845 [Candidatus Aenigmarchaeota archaeon]|nr:hypothetical protein [Candidatus Aenigmarchaeota archaeon]